MTDFGCFAYAAAGGKVGQTIAFCRLSRSPRFKPIVVFRAITDHEGDGLFHHPISKYDYGASYQLAALQSG